MKIAFFVVSHVIGGVEKTFITYANGLANKGYDVSFMVCYPGKMESLLSDSVKRINLGAKRLMLSSFRIAECIEKENIDIIICSNEHTIFVWLAKLLSKKNISIITSHHYYLEYTEKPKFTKYFLSIVYNRCNAVVAVSDGIMDDLANKLKVKNTLLSVIKNPVDVKAIRSQADMYIPENIHEKSIVWVGRFSPVKNLKSLILAFLKFKASYPSYKLYLIGDGEEFETIKKFIESKHENSSIILSGSKYNPFPYIKYSKMVVLSSLSECYPTVVLEAMALGKTVVSTPTIGSKEILGNGRYGIISKGFDEETLCDAMLIGVTNPVNRDVLNKAIIDSDVKTKVNEYVNLLEKFNP